MYKRYPEMLASGACVALDSDWPLIPADPLLKLYSVVTAEEIRPRFEGELCDASVLSAHTVSVWDGLRMQTINGAWSMNLDHELGTLEPGKLADLVVLSANPLRVDPYEIPSIEVVQTFTEGISAYGGS
jgi:predicted amidohydrolase YtcJ